MKLLISVSYYNGKMHYVDVRVHSADVRVHSVDVCVHSADVRVHSVDVRVHSADVRVHSADVRVHSADVGRQIDFRVTLIPVVLSQLGKQTNLWAAVFICSYICFWPPSDSFPDDLTRVVVMTTI